MYPSCITFTFFLLLVVLVHVVPLFRPALSAVHGENRTLDNPVSVLVRRCPSYNGSMLLSSVLKTLYRGLTTPLFLIFVCLVSLPVVSGFAPYVTEPIFDPNSIVIPSYLDLYVNVTYVTLFLLSIVMFAFIIRLIRSIYTHNVDFYFSNYTNYLGHMMMSITFANMWFLTNYMLIFTMIYLLFCTFTSFFYEGYTFVTGHRVIVFAVLTLIQQHIFNTYAVILPPFLVRSQSACTFRYDFLFNRFICVPYQNVKLTMRIIWTNIRYSMPYILLFILFIIGCLVELYVLYSHPVQCCSCAIPVFMYFYAWFLTYKLHRHHVIFTEAYDKYVLSLKFRTQSRKKLRTRGARKFHRRILHSQSFASKLSSFAEGNGMPDIDYKSTISVVESAFILAYQIADASSNKAKVVAVAAFVKSINGGESLTVEIIDRINDAFGDHMESQSFIDYINKGRDTHERMRGIRDSPGIAKIQNFLMYVLSLGIFSKAGLTLSKVGFSRIEEAALKRKHNSKLGLIDSLIEMALFVCTGGYQAYKGMSVEHIVHSPESYGTFYDDVEIFVQDFQRYEGTNIGSGVDHTNLLERLSKLLETYKEIDTLTSKLSAFDKKILLSVRGKLFNCRAKLRNEKICQSTRSAPLSILLTGLSGVGKSAITDILFAQFGNRRNLSVDSSLKYVRSPTAEFWDNFDPKMWCLVLDDMAWQHPKSTTIDPTVSEILHLINNVPYVTNQAALDKKGTTPFLGQLVIGTTNTPHLNTANYFSFPSAALRRFPFVINVSVKPEFANEAGNLETSSVMDYPNFWNFHVKNIIAVGRAVEEVTIAKYDDIGSLLAWYNETIDQFYARQERALNSGNKVLSCPTCEPCGLPKTVCGCDKKCIICERHLAVCGHTQDEINMHIHEVEAAIREDAEADIVASQSLVLGIGIGSALSLFCHWLFYTVVPRFIGNYVLRAINMRVGGIIFDMRMMWLQWTGRKKEAFMLLGKKVQVKIVKVPKFLLVMAGVLVVGVTLNRWMPTNDSQGNVVPMARERQDYYYSDTVATTSFEGTLKSKCIDLDSLAKKIESNVIYCEADTVTHTMRCRLLGIGGGLFITNSHSIPPDVTRLRCKLGVSRNGISEEREFVFSESQIVRDEANDLLMLHTSILPPRKDLLSFFLTTEPAGNATGLYLDRNKNGECSRIPMNHITYSSRLVSDLKKTLRCAGSLVASPTVQGQCGMPLLATCGQSKAIIGIHSMASIGVTRNHFAGSTIVTRSMLDDMVAQFTVPIVDTNDPVMSSQSAVRVLGALHPKSVFRYIEHGCATIHGSFVGFKPTSKSCVNSTPIRSSLARFGIYSNFVAPVMKGWRPWRIAAIDMVRPVTELSETTLRECGDAYLAHVLKSLPSGAITKMVHPIDEFDSLNGVVGVSFMDGIKRSTSAGAPFGKSKKYFIESTEPCRGLQDPIKLNQEMSDRVQHVRDCYAVGDRYRPIFTAHLKDEAVSPEKAATGKTRVFCGAPFDWSVVVREMFLGHVRLIQNFKYTFECGVGTVCPSDEWTTMYKHITKFGDDRIIAGDYKAYDKRMPPTIVMEAFRILIELAIEGGNFSEGEIRALWCIAHDTAYPLIDFNGDLVTFWGSNPSGHPLTVIINSIVNSLYMRYTYVQSGHSASTFNDNVSLITYGDDNIMSVNANCDNFNHTVIQEQLAAVDVIYTMADKTSESVPFIDITEANFLKRSWLFNEEEGLYTAPLDESSIMKMLCVFVTSKSITEGQQITEIIRSAHGEWWHYGKEVFEEKTHMLEIIIEENGLKSYFLDRPLPTYRALWEQFHESSEKTKFSLF